MKKNITAMKQELERLVHTRDASVGIDFRKTNYQIAELSNRIDCELRRRSA